MTLENYENLASSLGFNKKEYNKIYTLMGRIPSLAELVVFELSWFADAAVKAKRFYVTNLHKKNRYFLPNNEKKFGIFPLNDKDALIFTSINCKKSLDINPYERGRVAASDLMRSLYVKGASPLALLGALYFGDEEEEKNAAQEVLKAIESYNHKFQISHFSHKVNFHKTFKGDASFINLFAVGLCDRKTLETPSLKANSLVVYIGVPTALEGHDYLGDLEKDFFKTPKIVIEQDQKMMSFCQKLLEQKRNISLQEVGRGGLVAALLEILKKTGLGINLNLDRVPLDIDAHDIKSYEILSSETMGRFLVILNPEELPFIENLLSQMNLSHEILGEISETAHVKIHFKDKQEADIPLALLFDEAPLYEHHAFIDETPFPLAIPPDPVGIEAALKLILASSDFSSHIETITLKDRAHLYLTMSAHSRYMQSDAYLGGASSVVSAWRRLVSCGALPVAIKSMLNFGSPENMHIMGQFIRAVDGIKEAANKLNLPILGKDVSFYNESSEENGYLMPIHPSPSIAAIGLLKDGEVAVPMGMPEEGELFLVGEMRGEMGQTLWLREVCKREDGAPPYVDLRAEKQNGDFIRQEIAQNYIDACCDIADGGLLVTIAKMAMKTGIGCSLMAAQRHLPLHAYWFSEGGARYIVATKQGERFFDVAEKAHIPVKRLGKIGGSVIAMDYGAEFPISELLELNRNHRS